MSDVPLDHDFSRISDEERQDIIAQIDSLAEAHAKRATDDSFALRGKKKGLTFPVLVNLAALAVIGVSSALLLFYFRNDDAQFQDQRGVSNTVENQVIQQLQRESKAQLQRKDLEIKDIQSRLQSVAEERERLMVTMEEQIKAREDALRSKLTQELGSERQRLERQGVAGAELENRLSSYELDRKNEVSRALETYREQLETERKRTEADLQKVHTEYESRLALLGSERESLVASFQEKENELRKQLELRSRALQESKVATEADLRAAKEKLDALARERENEQRVENQVAGFLSRLRAAFREGRYDDALESIKAYRIYISPPGGAQILYPRRDLDTFIIEVVNGVIDDKAQRNAAADSISGELEELRRIKAALLEGDDLRKGRAGAGAVASYQKAFAVLPKLERAHAYLMARESERIENEAKGVVDALEARVRELETSEALHEATIADQKVQVSELLKRLDENEGRIETLQAGNAALESELSAAADQLAAARTEGQSSSEELEAVMRERRRLGERLAAAQAELVLLQESRETLEGLRKSYQSYTDRERELLSLNNAETIETKALMDSFIQSGEMRATFPGLLARIHRFDEAFESAGYRRAALGFEDLLSNLLYFENPSARTDYLTRRIEAAGEDEKWKALMTDLRSLVKR